MLLKTLIFYGCTVALAVAMCFAVSMLFKRKKQKIYKGHAVIGAVGFMAMLALVFWLGRFAFSEDVTMYVLEYMDPDLYKILAGILFFFVVATIRYFALNFFFFVRDKEEKGESFLLGFGICGSIIVAFYTLIMFLFILFTALGSKLESYSGGAFIFEDHTVISTFDDPLNIMLVVLIFAVYTALCFVTGEFMRRHATNTYGFLHSLVIYLIVTLCEVGVCVLFLFSVSQISLYAIAIITLLFTLAAFASVFFLYKYKEVKDYKNQFDD